jgi:hypothetical protein
MGRFPPPFTVRALQQVIPHKDNQLSKQLLADSQRYCKHKVCRAGRRKAGDVYRWSAAIHAVI